MPLVYVDLTWEEVVVAGNSEYERRLAAYEQEVSGLKVGVVVLHASSNRLADLKPLVPKILEALGILQIGQVIHIGA